MAGVEAAEDLTVEQLNAMAGGELLKAEVSVAIHWNLRFYGYLFFVGWLF